MTSHAYKVILTYEARDMLKEHVSFLKQVSDSATRVLHYDLLAKIKGLGKTPYLYPIFYSDSLEAEYHKLVYKRYLILYSIEEAKKTIRVKYIWDTRMDNSL